MKKTLKYTAIVLGCIIGYPMMCVIVGMWMSSGGWTYAEHKVFFHCWTIGPVVLAFVGCMCEEISRDITMSRYKKEIKEKYGDIKVICK